ncbi:hypothetical protein [Pseudomonas sp. PSE14]|uniref:hypothetical protein n=1 Tax=Pseudomonas sp. PSE14 TaxID=3016341 RepID=UPI0031F31501
MQLEELREHLARQRIADAVCDIAYSRTIHLSVFCIDQRGPRYYKPVEIAPPSLISDVLPKTAPRTQSDNLKEIKQLQKVFDDAPIDALTPAMVGQYRDASQAKVRANRENAALSHAFNIARERGLTKKENPCRGARKNKESPRDY